MIVLVHIGNKIHVIYPSVVPLAQTRGRNANACAILVESVISAVMLFIMPMLPLSAPFRQRL